MFKVFNIKEPKIEMVIDTWRWGFSVQYDKNYHRRCNFIYITILCFTFRFMI